MARLPFVKLHGCANDYVLLDATRGEIEEVATLARAVCERRTGIGADGLLVVRPPGSTAAVARMQMVNPDGSEAEMCGNGLRCLAKYLFDRGRAGREFLLETRAGDVATKVDEVDRAGRASRLTVAIGVPDFERRHVPMVGPPGAVLDEPFALANRELRLSALRLGNPHAVVFVEDVERFPVQSVGPAIERDARFPERVNVEFVQVIGAARLRQRTWERGAGETQACGSGATAAAIIARRVLGLPTRVVVELRGGELEVEWTGERAPALLRGPAVETCSGELDLGGVCS
jgi:diaminopimelate epimerase